MESYPSARQAAIGGLAAQLGQNAPDCDGRPLESIGIIADEAERCAGYINAFIVRFRHGNLPESTAPAQQLTQVRSGHAGQIDRLRDAVSEIDRLARDLGTLG